MDISLSISRLLKPMKYVFLSGALDMYTQLQVSFPRDGARYLSNHLRGVSAAGLHSNCGRLLSLREPRIYTLRVSIGCRDIYSHSTLREIVMLLYIDLIREINSLNGPIILIHENHVLFCFSQSALCSGLGTRLLTGCLSSGIFPRATAVGQATLPSRPTCSRRTAHRQERSFRTATMA